MIRYLIPILTFVLFLFGLLMLYILMYSGNIGIYSLALTFSTFVGFVVLLVNKNYGVITMFTVSIGWLLRYSEYASFLTLYNDDNEARRIVVAIPILLSIVILALTYKFRQDTQGKPFSIKIPALLICGIAIIGLLSFVRKPHVNQFNCWYFIDNHKKNYKISFSVSPNHIFETDTDSEKLKEFVVKYGIRDEFRPGIYCPETKVRVITRFKKIVTVEILGFHNTTTNTYATLENAIEIDINKISGDKSILEPSLILGD